MRLGVHLIRASQPTLLFRVARCTQPGDGVRHFQGREDSLNQQLVEGNPTGYFDHPAQHRVARAVVQILFAWISLAGVRQHLLDRHRPVDERGTEIARNPIVQLEPPIAG